MGKRGRRPNNDKETSHMEKRTIRTFEDLIVWQKAIEFVKRRLPLFPFSPLTPRS
jgi:hypothetical protein